MCSVTQKELLSPQELADFLGIPLATVRRWRYHGEGPPGMRLGRHVRYQRAAVMAWLEAQQSSGDSK
jgi:excisionase family DNA binding protein